jgi:hypothetical protein
MTVVRVTATRIMKQAGHEVETTAQHLAKPSSAFSDRTSDVRIVFWRASSGLLWSIDRWHDERHRVLRYDSSESDCRR